MISLQLPNSRTALRLGSEFLAKLAEHSDEIRDEAGGVPPIYDRVYAEMAEAQPVPPPQNDPDESDDDERVLEVATPAPKPAAGAEPTTPGAPSIARPLPGELGSPEMDAALADAPREAIAPAVPPATFAQRLVYDEASAGYPLQAMREAGWSDQALVDAGYALWEEVTAPAPLAPSAPVPPAPPAPPAPAIAPSENNSNANTSTASGAVDSAGLPWDERIHSSSRNTVADGTWRRKRGVDEALVQQVEAELRGAPKLHVGAGIPTAPSAPTAPAPAPVPPVAAAVAAPDSPNDFPSLTRWVLPLTTSGKISPTDVQLIIAEVGAERAICHLPGLAAHPDLIPAVVARIKAKVGL